MNKSAVAAPDAGAFAISKARSQLILRAPFFAVLVLKLDPKPHRGVETCATDGNRLWYNPKWAAETSLDELVGVLAQKAMRVALGHPWRRGGREQALWQQAGDAVVNPIIRDSKFKLPDNAINMPEFEGKSAEEAYSVLLKRQPPRDENGSQKPEQGTGRGPGQSGGQNPPNPQQDDGSSPPQEGQGDGQSDGPPGGFGGDCGGCGEILDQRHEDGSAMTESERDEAEQDWKVTAMQAAAIAKSAGQMPGNLERLFEEAEKPKLDWRSMLRRFMQGKRHDDFSWRRPNRRFIGRGLYLPSRENPGPGEIAVAIDTSGSISSRELAAFSAELNAILDEVKPKLLRVIYCDAAVNGVEEYTPDDYPVKLKAIGGGGTSFKPVFQWLAKNEAAPEAVIYLTDLEGYGDAFGPESPWPTLWITTAREEAPWGEIARLDLEKVEA